MNTLVNALKRISIVAGAACLTPSLLAADEVGRVGVDWVGNDIIIEAIPDPEVQGVTCHIAYFERSLFDRLSNGNWFEDPSNAAIDCRQTGPIVVGDIDRSWDGENVFRERQSIVLKSVVVKRIFDADNNTLIYLAHASELSQGSAKMSISTIPLYETGAVRDD
ncbi:CreA family protein [Yoonia sp. 208BN28-4]|uniref:CreA family protein n=1 Tax=Yoonia sp. 208BN28-4 TaxID=3126505 RepID=UPI0030A1573B